MSQKEFHLLRNLCKISNVFNPKAMSPATVLGSVSPLFSFLKSLLYKLGLGFILLGNKPAPGKRVKKPRVIFDQKLDDLAKAISEKNGVIIFYGSQSGTSMNFAKVFMSKLSRISVECVVCDPGDYEMRYLVEIVRKYGDSVIFGFFVSSYGEGGPTDNMLPFFEWITSSDLESFDSEEKPVLFKMRCFVLGLGNSTYQDYNGASKVICKRLVELGASVIGELGLCDECNNRWEDFNSWQKTEIELIARILNIDVKSESIRAGYRSLPHVSLAKLKKKGDSLWNSGCKILMGSIGIKRRWTWSSDLEEYVEDNSAKAHYSQTRPYYSKVLSCKSIIKDTFDTFTFNAEIDTKDLSLMPIPYTLNEKQVSFERQVYHVELNLRGSNIKYETGDYVCIIPKNNEENVRRLIAALRWEDIQSEPVEIMVNPDMQFMMAKSPVSGAVSPLVAFTYYLDISAPLTQDRLDIIARCTKNKDISKKIFDIGEDSELYKTFILDSRRCLADLIEEFNEDLELPQEVVLAELFDRIIPRFYSISSSSMENPNLLSITTVVTRYILEYPSRGKLITKQREGLATSWIQRNALNKTFEKKGSADFEVIKDGFAPENYVPMFIKTSTFKLPAPKIPIIMIGTGTGVAPFRGFVRERLQIAKSGTQVGKTLLFFGSRTENDYLYKDEFEDLSENKPCNFDFTIYKAFSRIPGKPRELVMNRIKEQSDVLWKLLEKENACLYLCGGAGSVQKSIKPCLMEILNANNVNGEEYLNKLLHTKRYFEDFW